MKFSVLQENLSKGLQTVCRAIPTKAPLPILANVLIRAEKGELVLSATNLETAITTHIKASVEETGSVTIPAKLIKEFVATLPQGTIEAELQKSTLILKSKKTKSRLNGTSAEDFPQLPDIPKKAEVIEINPGDFEEVAAMVGFAAGNDSSRPIFTGVYISYNHNLMTIAATDGFRLSEKTIKVKGPEKEFTTIIPAKTFLEIARIFATYEEPIEMVLDENENLVLFKSGETLTATRILEGQYPDYKKIIPTEHTLKAIFSSEEFLEAVKLSSIFAKEGDNRMKLGFYPDEACIRVSSLEVESGEHESEFPAEIEGEFVEVAFNSKYLLDFLNNIKTEFVLFNTSGNVTPCTLKPKELEDFIHVIMPIQI